MSSNGSYLDGWAKADVYSADKLGSQFDVKSTAIRAGLLDNLDLYSQPTEVCDKYIMNLLLRLEEFGLYPRRARYTILPAGSSTVLHRDWPSSHYGVRLIIPIASNYDCFYFENDKKHFLEVGRAYLADVSKLHRTANNGTSDRINFICDVFDTEEFSQFHRMSPSQKSFVKNWDRWKLRNQMLQAQKG